MQYLPSEPPPPPPPPPPPRAAAFTIACHMQVEPVTGEKDHWEALVAATCYYLLYTHR